MRARGRLSPPSVYWREPRLGPRRKDMASIFSLRTLLIEDNPGDVHLIEFMLRRSEDPRFELRTAGTLAAGLDLMSLQRPDIILLDLKLPDSQGLTTLRRVMNLKPEAPVIVVTDFDDRQLALEAIREGARDYLVKDRVDWRLLVRTLLRHLVATGKIGRSALTPASVYPDAVKGAGQG